MDSDAVCNDFHLRMTVATTEHERFSQLLSVLVPTPETVVTPQNLTAINDAKNILTEAIGAVCEAYGQLDDCDDLDPDEARVMDDAFATVQRWNEEVGMVMVQIQQVVWDSQHGHIRRLISGTRNRSGGRAHVKPKDEEPDTECEVFDSDDFTEEPTEESAEAVEEEPEEIVLTSEEDEPIEEPEEMVPTPDEEEEPVEPETIPEEPEPVEPAEATIPPVIPREEYERIREEALKEGYSLGVADTVAKLAETAKADETADAVAAESKPLGRKTRSAKKTEKPAKGHRILRKKEGSE